MNYALDQIVVGLGQNMKWEEIRFGGRLGFVNSEEEANFPFVG